MLIQPFIHIKWNLTQVWRSSAWSSYTCFSLFWELRQVGEIHPTQIIPIMGTNTQKVIYSVKLHISHQMKPYLSVKPIWGSIYTCFLYLQIVASSQNLAQLPQIMGRITQKVIQIVKFYISHQMKPYSKGKVICGSSYTCFSIFGELGQV